MRTPNPPKIPVDAPREAAEAVHPALGDCVGRMIVELIHNGTGRPIPQVRFDPVGLFTPGLLGDHLQTFAAAVEHAQSAVRRRVK